MQLGRRADLGADCASCFGLCCVALAFDRSADFGYRKQAGEPCVHLAADDSCRIHPQLAGRGFRGCTVFDCFGAGQLVSRSAGGRSWRADAATRTAMFGAFPVVRRLHELLWYLDQAITLMEPIADPARWAAEFDRVRELSRRPAEDLGGLDAGAQFDAARPLLIEASEAARAGVRRRAGRVPGPASDLTAARLAGADLRGVTLRGSTAIAADLTGAQLRRCDVLGVDLRGADLSGADLDGAIYLTQMQVSGARGDAATVLPAGFARPPHWAGS